MKPGNLIVFLRNRNAEKVLNPAEFFREMRNFFIYERKIHVKASEKTGAFFIRLLMLTQKSQKPKGKDGHKNG